MAPRFFPFAVTIILLALWAQSALSDPSEYAWRSADPLLYGQAVIEGVIAEVELRDVSTRSLGFGDGAPPTGTIATLVLLDAKCLRGACIGQRLNAELVVDWRDLVGRRVILCSDWFAPFGDYLIRGREQVFLFDDGAWKRLAPIQQLTDADIRNELANLQFEAIAQRADLVVAGRVIAVTDSVVDVSSKMRSRILRATIEVESAAKSMSPRIIEFGGNEWEARIPRLRVGEHWVAFLQRRGDGYWVTSGTNGLLKIGKNDQLLFDGVAPLRLNRSQLEKALGSKRHDN